MHEIVNGPGMPGRADDGRPARLIDPRRDEWALLDEDLDARFKRFLVSLGRAGTYWTVGSYLLACCLYVWLSLWVLPGGDRSMEWVFLLLFVFPGCFLVVWHQRRVRDWLRRHGTVVQGTVRATPPPMTRRSGLAMLAVVVILGGIGLFWLNRGLERPGQILIHWIWSGLAFAMALWLGSLLLRRIRRDGRQPGP
jgi:hypothetical protein